MDLPPNDALSRQEIFSVPASKDNDAPLGLSVERELHINLVKVLLACTSTEYVCPELFVPAKRRSFTPELS